MNDFQTLPRWCQILNVPLDRAREVIRRSPELRELGRRFGSARAYSPDEAQRIAAAVLGTRAGERAPC
jgi:hypothetical protein